MSNVEEAISPEQNFVASELNAARDHLQAGRAIKVRRHCRKVLDREPGNIDALLLLAGAAIARGRSSEASEFLEKASTAAPADIRVRLARGDFYVSQKQLVLAVPHYQAVLEAKPDQFAAAAGLAVCLQTLGDAPGALAAYRKALEIDPFDARLNHNLGTLLKQQHDFEGATKAYRRAIELAPHEKGFRLRLGLALLESGEYREATENLDVLARQLPEHAQCAYFQAYGHMKLGEGPQAVAAAERFLRINGPSAATLTSIASTQLCAGNSEAARSACEQALEVSPGNRQALSDYAIALAGTDETRRAQRIFNADTLLHAQLIQAPPGYASVTDFNQALLKHIKGHPTLDFGRVSLSCHNGATSTDLLVPPLGPMAELAAIIRAEVERYQNALPDDPEHPYLGPLPACLGEQELAAWATILKNQGYQHGHIHATAWLSGVYYVSLPEAVDRGDGACQGWIEFGRAPAYYAAKHQGSIKPIQPQEGLLLLFPSYFYHRTLPFESDSERVTIAFDLGESGISIRTVSTSLNTDQLDTQ